jgi:hypothetical protein
VRCMGSEKVSTTPLGDVRAVPSVNTTSSACSSAYGFRPCRLAHTQATVYYDLGTNRGVYWGSVELANRASRSQLHHPLVGGPRRSAWL